jgi:hypothetical protein
MAAGKSTLAKELAEREGAILLIQDELLDHPFPDEITGIPGFVIRAARLGTALAPHVCALVAKGTSCTSSTCPTPCASAGSRIGAGASLPARRGPRTRSSRPSPRIFGPRRKKRFNVVRHERA